MGKVVASIPYLEVQGSLERNKEVYVVSFASFHGFADGAEAPPVVGSHNVTLEATLPGLARQAAGDGLVPSVSNVFPRLRKGRPASLSGSGILLYPNLDPGPLLGLTFAVVESDERQRNVGGVLRGVLDHPGVKGVVRLAGAAAGPAAWLPALMGAVSQTLPEILQANRDDVLLVHTHSGGDYDNYGVSAGPGMPAVQDFPLENDRVKVVLRLRVNA